MGSRIIYALDYPSLREATAGADRVAPALGMVKVGLELFVEAGPAALEVGHAHKLPVFLDLKLHDIPATVERAVARACALGARLLTLHAGGGASMLERAVTRATKEATGLHIVAVTVLTSFDDADLAQVGVSASTGTHATRLAELAWKAGVRHFVCSPHEALAMRAKLGNDAVLITPGVRPAESARDDQKRVATAEEAVASGADWLVVGRPIRDAADPLAAASRLRDEAQRALSKRGSS